ncbi:MAG: glycoside hydrolase family 31 protein [Kiritimatiellia bacterium]|nr:glycoside hydrolase family 31 protein [Kiritimatiellia bacterium]
MTPLDCQTENGILRLEPAGARALRIRMSADGRFAEGGLTRYGIVKTAADDVPYSMKTEGGDTVFSTDSLSIAVDSRGGVRFSTRGKDLLRSAGPLRSDAAGFSAAFELDDTEKIYGLGDVARDRVEKRGFRTAMWVRNVASYVPIPFLMSSRGWAIFVNTTWRHYFDVGAKIKNRVQFWAKEGDLDFFLIAGDSFEELLDLYTERVGRPQMLPLWAYGLTFVCNQQAHAREMIDDALHLRRADIPCDVIGLEPGWMSKHYDLSVEKTWHEERFYIPPWVRKPGDPSVGNDQTFMGAARRLGFKVSLWLCCDYDLSFEEERRKGSEAVGGAESEPVERPEDDFEQDDHFGHGASLMDRVTRPEEPWFDHLKKFVADGASAFKMDGAFQVNAHPDRRWGNGMTDEEMHNLYPTLLNKQMHLGFREFTNRRPMIYTSGGYAGIQQYSATWAGDTGGGIKPLVSMINHGLSGHVNTSCDMDVFSPAGIHFGFLQPWAQVCSWAYWRHPWLLGDKLLPVFRYYAKLRYRLLPYIYSAAHRAARTGFPILRGMPLVAPDDPASDQALHQYMLGDFLLTAAFTNKMHLPAGRWIDFWTGTTHSGPADLELDLPEDRGGPLFVREGALLPQYPEMDYIGQRPLNDLLLDVYPGAEGVFTMVEDDGISFDYTEGKTAVTEMRLKCAPGRAVLTVAPRRGIYNGMPETRAFSVICHVGKKPAQVLLNGNALAEDPTGYRFDSEKKTLTLDAVEDPKRKQTLEIVLID